jgi:ligand-binding sensor domain-containing protein
MRVGGFYAATNYGLVHFRSDQSVEGLYYRIKLINGKSEPVWMHRVDALLLQGGKVKYISSLEGVFEVRGDSMLFLGDDQPLLKGRFDTFLRGRDGNIYIGSRTKGLIVMRRDSLYHVNEDNGLSGNQVYAIEKGIKNCVWVGTNNGLCKLCLDKRGKATFKQITAAQGIISNGIRSLCYMGQQLYVGAENGLFKMQPDRVYRNQVAPRLHLTQVLINAEAVDFSDQPMVLKSSENQVQLNYSGITFRNPQHLYYQYRLDGIESAWQSTQNRTVRFDYLPSGRYTFRIKAVNEDGVASKEVLLEFEILQPLWLKWWFLLGIFLLLVGVVILIVQRRERQIRKVLEVERKMIELELKALRSQMNPHFTFNTLGAIQQYIMKRDPLVANNYIASFAKLIRKVLENSKDDHIILQEELDTIRLYLDLECIRFEGKLSYEIKVQSAVEATYLEIPPMIIQPYVENAILHGILPSERPGVVQIEVNTTPNGLHVIVRDNGIGRTRSSEMKHSDLFKGKSLGMKITSERLELIKESSNLIYNVEVADITGDENEIIGTEVTLIFPLDLNHDK